MIYNLPQEGVLMSRIKDNTAKKIDNKAEVNPREYQFYSKYYSQYMFGV